MDTDEGIAGAAWVGDGGAVAGLTRRRLTTLVGEDPLLTEKLSTRIWEIDRIKEMQMPHLGLIDLLARNIHAQSRSAAQFLARTNRFQLSKADLRTRRAGKPTAPRCARSDDRLRAPLRF
jgi:hypothetical protein